jgi:hypothetical protein
MDLQFIGIFSKLNSISTLLYMLYEENQHAHLLHAFPHWY